MKIKIKSAQGEIVADLNDSAEAKDLISQLPLHVEFEDYASKEKIFYPPRKLKIEDEDVGFSPQAFDVCYYVPWGDVVLFYEDFVFAKGLMKLGRVIQGEELVKDLPNAKIKIEAVE